MRLHCSPGFQVIFFLMTSLILHACGDVSDRSISQPAVSDGFQEKVLQNDVPQDKAVRDKNAHGMLAPPHFDTSLEELTGRRIALQPRIGSVSHRGGRYYTICVIDNTRFAVANLRGVDFFDLEAVQNGTFAPFLQVDTVGDAWSVACVRNTIWVADGYAGVAILDADDGHELKRLPELSHARDFHTMADGRMVVCRHSRGADIVRLGPSGMDVTETLHVDLGERVFSATSDQSRVFFGTLGAGYIAVDADTGETPDRQWVYRDCERIVWCHYADGKHYLLDQDIGLLILADRGDQPPEPAGRFELSGQSRYAYLMANGRLLIAHQHGLYLVDVGDPSRLVLLSHLPALLEGRSVAVIGDRIVFTESEYGIRLLSPAGGVFSETAVFRHNGLVSDVAMIDDTHCVMAHTGQGAAFLTVCPKTHAVTETERYHDLQYPVSVAVNGRRVAIADYRGITFLETAPGQPARLMGRLDTPGRAVGVALDRDFAYVADWFEGLQVIRFTETHPPEIVSSIPVNGWAIDVATSDGFAYVCSVTEGLMTVDIRDPLHPRKTAVDRSAQAPEAVTVNGKAMYVADFNFGLIVYERTQPENPVPVACYRLDVCKNVAVRGDLLIVSNYIHGIKWFDVTDSLRPILVGELDTSGKGYGVAFLPDKNSILAADWHGLLQVEW